MAVKDVTLCKEPWNKVQLDHAIQWMNKQVVRKNKAESARMNPSLNCWLDGSRARARAICLKEWLFWLQMLLDHLGKHITLNICGGGDLPF